MIRTAATLALLLTALPVEAQPKAGSVRERIARVEAGLLPRVLVEDTLAPQLRLSERMVHHGVPGLSVAVIDGGKVAWARSYGVAELGDRRKVTARTRFQVGDLSMLVSGAGALALCRQGKLELDEDVQRWLRSWRVPETPLTETRKVTVRKLLSHSGGFGIPWYEGYVPVEDIPNLLQVLEGAPPSISAKHEVEYQPGLRTRYSAGGYSVLQQVMVDAAKVRFAPLMQRLVLGPLRMKSSSYDQPPSRRVRALLATGHTAKGTLPASFRVHPSQAANGLWASAEDLAHFIVEVQRAKAGKGRVLDEAMAREYLTPGFGGQALGPKIYGDGEAARFTQVGQSEGFDSLMVGYLDAGKGAVVLTNLQGGLALAHEVVLGIAAEYEWPGYAPRPAKRIAPEVLDGLAGRYLLEPLERPGVKLAAQEAEALVRAGQLYWRPAGVTERSLWAEGRDRFFGLDGAPGVRFERDVKGRVTGVTVHGNGVERKGKRIEAKPPAPAEKDTQPSGSK